MSNKKVYYNNSLFKIKRTFYGTRGYTAPEVLKGKNEKIKYDG